MRLLITGGGTREPIDQVRVITNTSSGRTASTLCDYFIKKGAEVTYLMAEQSQRPVNHLALIQTFTTHASLEALLHHELSTTPYDAVIHAAAVSDYTVEAIYSQEKRLTFTEKVSSDLPLTIHLKPALKIIQNLRNYSLNPSILLIGFKLTATSQDAEKKGAVEKLFQSAQPDYVVHNDLSQYQFFTVYGPQSITPCSSVTDLGDVLLRIIKDIKK
jgi:phosphopantothenoylcysteine decarboxylase/phosphopantothenate--cysteine ligase